MNEYLYIFLIISLFFAVLFFKPVRRGILRAILGCATLVFANAVNSSIVLSSPGILMSLALGIPGALSYSAINFIIK